MTEHSAGKISYTLISGGFIQNPGEVKQKKNILIKGDKIIDLLDFIPSDIENLRIIEANDSIITPGLIDQHIHGGYGCNFNRSDVDTIINFLVKLPEHGITSICPTIMTDTVENTRVQIERVAKAKSLLPENSAKIAGINLEGPFLNPEYKGAHEKELFLNPTIENYQQIESDETRIVTIAPELDKGLELTKYLVEKKIIASAGHSKANTQQIKEGFEVGLKQITHIFNAMPALHHREPGVIGSSLVNDDVYVEVIADYNHLHPDIVKLILSSKPENKVIFISDSLPLNQSSENSTIFGGQKIFNRGEYAVNEEGRFAGSLLFLDSIVRKNLNSVKFPELLRFCSQNPAKNLNLNDCGYITHGMTADLVIWKDETFEIQDVLINGIFYNR